MNADLFYYRVQTPSVLAIGHKYLGQRTVKSQLHLCVFGAVQPLDYVSVFPVYDDGTAQVMEDWEIATLLG